MHTFNVNTQLLYYIIHLNLSPYLLTHFLLSYWLYLHWRLQLALKQHRISLNVFRISRLRKA